MNIHAAHNTCSATCPAPVNLLLVFDHPGAPDCPETVLGTQAAYLSENFAAERIDASHSSSASRPANTKIYENGHAKNIEQGCLSTAISGSHQRGHMAQIHTCSKMQEMQRQQDALEAKSLDTYCTLRHFSRCWKDILNSN